LIINYRLNIKNRSFYYAKRYYEDSNLELENFKKKQIDEWVENGANPLEAEHLFDEMVNDPYYSDPDIDIFSDYSINSYTLKLK